MFHSREASEEVAATSSQLGADEDYESLTSQLMVDAVACDTELQLEALVRGIAREMETENRLIRTQGANPERKLSAAYVFVAAGDGTLPLFQTAGPPETTSVGGFPISGLFLRTDTQKLINNHRAKVYGHPADGEPAISVPHRDLRVLDGREYLLF